MNIQRKSSNGIGAFIAAICIVIYLFALVQAAVRLYLNIDASKNTADREFSNLAILALTASTQGFMSDSYRVTMSNELSRLKSIEAFIISGPDGEYVFERQQGHAVAWVNNSPRFLNRFYLTTGDYNRPLQIQNVRNANIRAIAGVFDNNEVIRILKETLFVILAGFTLAFFTMLLQTLLGKQSDKTVPLYVPKRKQAKEPIKEITAVETEKPEENKEAAPKRSYSTRGVIGREEEIKERLDSELHLCSSTEKDLTLMLMEFTDITNDDMFAQAAEEAVSFFSSKDMLFEYGDKGISAILPGINLDEGIAEAEKFYKRVMEKFPYGYKSSSSVCIGLTSRLDRLLDSDRLMLEGRGALQRAKSDPKSPIIAFKSDPEKYRAFIASQN
ncbi:MAG: hypothetical protein LBQ89_03720 [Treponema sp.]|jgi:hypothetical protein|nr:hypothetical protein [Treponema sp.]